MTTKTRNNCVFHVDRERHQNGCALLHDGVYCVPEKCSWHMTHKQRIDSYVRAVRAWQRSHPGKNWDEDKTLVPKDFRAEVKKAIKMAQNV